MTEPTSALSFDALRGHVLRQHGELRARMRGLERMAAGRAHQALAPILVSFGRFMALFEEHLAFEEKHLGPLLRTLDGWGEARESAMRAEHVEQRQRIEALCALVDAREGRDAEIRGEIRWLLRTLGEDMEREEAELASLVDLEAHGSLQMTG